MCVQGICMEQWIILMEQISGGNSYFNILIFPQYLGLYSPVEYAQHKDASDYIQQAGGAGSVWLLQTGTGLINCTEPVSYLSLM